MDFIDARLVEHAYFMERYLTPVRKHERNPVFEPLTTVSTVLRDPGGILRMWYETRVIQPDNFGPFATPPHCLRYAESDDGVVWRCPELGLREENGSTANNLLMRASETDAAGRPLTGTYGVQGCCVLDAELGSVPHARGRFTALYSTNLEPSGGLCLAYSDDGLRWLAYPENPVARGSDTFNNLCYDAARERYVLYVRPTRCNAGPRRANRLMALLESRDLVHWGVEQIVLDTDRRDAPAAATVDEGIGYPRGRDVQFYGMTVTPYENLFLGLAPLYDVRQASMAVRLLHSYDGVDWRREPLEEDYIPRTPHAWDCQMVAFVAAGSPLRVAGQLFIYYGGCDYDHHYAVAYPDPKPGRRGAGLAVVPAGRLAGYHAGQVPGELLTRPFILKGPGLTVNVDAQAGEVRVGLMTAEGKWVPGYTLDEAMPIRENALRTALSWKDKPDVRALIGQALRLRFAATNAAVHGYAMENKA